jgi:endonuclease YncB( thermonuclease family)
MSLGGFMFSNVRVRRVWAGALVVTSALGASIFVAGPAAATVEDYASVPKHARVVDVVDGDTIHVWARDGNKASVRLIGINSPEVYYHVECGGYAAKRYAERLVKPGMHVTLLRVRAQGNYDRYGRSLRYVILPGDRDLGARMLRSGLAVTAYDSGSYGTHPRRAWYHRLDAAHNYPRCPALR